MQEELKNLQEASKIQEQQYLKLLKERRSLYVQTKLLRSFNFVKSNLPPKINPPQITEPSQST